MSRVASNPIELDTVKRSKQFDRRRGFDVLLQAQAYWGAMSKFRKDRERNKRYTYGDQWGDIITIKDPDTGCERSMVEEDYIRQEGNTPLKNNLIRRYVKTVLGVFRNSHVQPVCTARDRDEAQMGETLTTVLQANADLNQLDEVDARTLEEFLISSFAVQKLWYGWRKDKLDCWTDYVQPNNFFIDNGMRDFRGWDVSCLGEVHDVSFETLCEQFAKSPEDYKRLADIYRTTHNRSNFVSCFNEFGYSRPQTYDFLLTTDPTKCRVIEVWRKESKPRYRCHDYNTGEVYKIEVDDYLEMVKQENEYRMAMGRDAGMEMEDVPLIEAEWFMDNYWYCYYLSPFGDILEEGETPYEHKGHPYVFKAYPFIDGEIHSFVADIIDQQRFLNQYAMLSYWATRASAKGVLNIPEEALGGKMSLQEMLTQWARPDGVIISKTKDRHGNNITLPHQINNNVNSLGLNEMLQIQLRFMDDITGVHGAMQGQTPASGTSGSLYSQQIQQASTSIADQLSTFNSFRRDGAYKRMKDIQQYYDQKRYIKISGKDSWIEYDPERVRDTEYDLSMNDRDNIPVYRQINNQFLAEIWRSGQLMLEDILEIGEFPYGDAILQHIRSNQERMRQGEQPEAMPQELQQQVEQGANQDVVNGMYNMLKESRQAPAQQ